MKTTEQGETVNRADLFAVEESAVNAVLSRLDDIPAMPLTAAEILRLTKTPDVEVKEIEKAIQSDPALTAKVLRIANSAFYGLKVPVSTLSHALMVLGLYQLRSVVVAAAYRGLYAKVPHAVEGLLSDIWRHSVVTGFVARELAKKAGIPQTEECFVVGLMHDIGQVVLARRFTEEYARLCKEAQDAGIDKRSVERSRWGVDHTMVGATILDRWKIAPGLANYLRYHHEPALASEEERRFVSVICLADRFDRNQMPTRESLDQGDFPQILGFAGLDADQLFQSLEELKARIAEEASSINNL